MTWPDGHESRFPKDWLLKRTFNEENAAKFKSWSQRPKPMYWQADFAPDLKIYKFQDVMENDHLFFEWLNGNVELNYPGKIMRKFYCFSAS